MGHAVTVFEALGAPGGMLRVGIPEYRLPRSILDAEIAVIKRLGVDLRTDTKLGRDLTLQELRRSGYEAMLVAIGAHQSRRLGVPGDDAAGVMYGLDFLAQVNRSESVDIGRTVAVVGGGNTAIDSARTALRLGAEHVYLLYRRTSDEMPASNWEIDEAEAEGVKILYLVAPEEVVVENGRAARLRCLNLFLGKPDESARRRPVPVDGTEFTLAVDTVISAVSQTPDTGVLEGDSGLTLSEEGLLEADPETGWTSLADTFAAGDATGQTGSVIEAIAAGKNAAAAIDDYLAGRPRGSTPTVERKQVDPRSVLRRSNGKPPDARVPQELLDAEVRRHNFEPVELPLTEAQAVEEAKRCLACGCGVGCGVCQRVCIYGAVRQENDKYAVDETKCDGCGLCVERCPNDAVEMVPIRN